MTNRMKHTPSYLDTATLGKYWTSVGGQVTVASGWYKYSGSSAGTDLLKTFDSQTGWTVGFKFKYTTAAGSNQVLVTLLDGTVVHTELRFTGNTGLFNVARNGTLIQTGTTALSQNTEYYVEWQVVIADSPNGVSILHIDAVVDAGINSSALDTRNAGNASANIVDFTPTTSSSGQIRDMYVNDNAGGAPDDTFWGPIVIATCVVQSDGNKSEWVPLSSTNASNVDDATPDDDTTYNATSTNAKIDTFVMSDTGYSAGTVLGVEWVADIRRTDASATARVAPVYRIAGTDYVGTDIVPTTTYLLQVQESRLQPVGGTPAWDVSTIDGMEIGYKRTAA